MIKNGTRLQSQVCDTQVIVVKAADSLDDLRCGGRPMLPLDAEQPTEAAPDPAFADGSPLGKGYGDDGDAERRRDAPGTKGTQAVARQRLSAGRVSATYLRRTHFPGRRPRGLSGQL